VDVEAFDAVEPGLVSRLRPLVGETPHQVGHHSPQHVRAAFHEAERMDGHCHLRMDQHDGGVDVGQREQRDRVPEIGRVSRMS